VAAQNSDATTLVVLDSDTLFLDEPELLGPHARVAARPIDLKGSATTGPETKFEAYWVESAKGRLSDRSTAFVEPRSEGNRRASYTAAIPSCA